MTSDRTSAGFVRILCLCPLVACGAAPDAGGESAPVSVAAPTAVVSASRSPSIESSQVNGVWIFQIEPGVAQDARLQGVARVVDGCLHVDDNVVVWQSSDAQKVEALVSSLMDRPAREVVLGGGGSSLRKSSAVDAFFAELTELCPTSEVWSAGPLSADWIVE